jgi:pimeloyl-ACP methyl ester carboxylesterase
MKPRALLIVAVAASAALLTGGCSSTDDPPHSSSQSQTSNAATSEAADEVAETQEDIDIGGRELFLRCWGEPAPGEPTVLLMSGSGPTTSTWELMAPDFAADGHHLCAYDRLGVGRSDSLPEGPRSTQDQIDDLLGLLDAVDLQEPVALAAHSLGSLPAVGLVDRAPERVAGVVLIDPWSPRVAAAQRAALPPKKSGESPELATDRQWLNNFLHDPAQNPEHLLLADEDQAAVRLLDAPGPFFGDLPVVVLRRPPPPYDPAYPRQYHRAYVAAIVTGAQEFASESTRGTLTEVEDTGHNIHEDRPEVVTDAILDVLAG